MKHGQLACLWVFGCYMLTACGSDGAKNTIDSPGSESAGGGDADAMSAGASEAGAGAAGKRVTIGMGGAHAIKAGKGIVKLSLRAH